jgi:hypothetical protein
MPEPTSTGSRADSDTARSSVLAGGFAGGGAGQDQAVGEEKFGGVRGLDDVDIGGEGVGGVLLLDVGEDGDGLGADGLAVAQEFAGAGVHVAFVGHVAEDESLGADEVGAGGERGGQGFAVGAGQDLDAEGEVRVGVLISRARTAMAAVISGPGCWT